MYDFTPDPLCPKCGSGEVRIRWTEIKCRDCELHDYLDTITAEHLHCVCPRCGFSWPMAIKETAE